MPFPCSSMGFSPRAAVLQDKPAPAGAPPWAAAPSTWPQTPSTAMQLVLLSTFFLSNDQKLNSFFLTFSSWQLTAGGAQRALQAWGISDSGDLTKSCLSAFPSTHFFNQQTLHTVFWTAEVFVASCISSSRPRKAF